MNEPDPRSNSGGPMGTGMVDVDPDPDCRIDGCDRPGEVPRKLRGRGDDEPAFEHHLCRFHHRVFLTVKVAVVVAVLCTFLVVFFTQ